MKKYLLLIASMSFLIWYSVIPQATQWCKDDSFTFRTSTSFEHSGDAAKTAKLRLCLLVEKYPPVLF